MWTQTTNFSKKTLKIGGGRLDGSFTYSRLTDIIGDSRVSPSHPRGSTLANFSAPFHGAIFRTISRNLISNLQAAL
jgi:hypothetical protein